MARLEITNDGLVRVTMSRRNLVALLTKLDWPGSARTITNRYCFVDGALVDHLVLVLRSESDEEHYGDRDEPPGPMHPYTEEAIRQEHEPE